MFDYEKWQEIFNSIRRHKLRTLLTALSVWWGIFMLVILMGMGNGLQNSVEHNFKDDAINSLWMWPGRTSKPYKGLPAGRWIRFTNEDYDLVKNQIEQVDNITGRYYPRGEFAIKYKEKSLSFDIRAVHPGHQFLENTIVTNGRFINDKDIEEKRKVCVIGKIVAEDFFGREMDPIGEYLSIKGVKFQVVGVFYDEGHRREMQYVYTPITTMQSVESANGRMHMMMMTVGNASIAESKFIEARIRSELAVRHKFDPNDREAIYINNEAENYEEFQMVFRVIKAFLWFVGIGSIIAGVIGVSNIMLIVVKDRTKEIGIRKAIGATPGSIISMILQESIFLTSVAGYIGVISGFSLIYLLNYILVEVEFDFEYFRDPEVDFMTILYALIFLVICGALAGLIPALQAVRINAVTAMKG